MGNIDVTLWTLYYRIHLALDLRDVGDFRLRDM